MVSKDKMESAQTGEWAKISTLQEDYEKQIFDLKQLIEISKGLNSTLDFSLLLDSILFACMGQMKVFDAGVFTRRELCEKAFSLHRNYKGFDLEYQNNYQIPDTSPVVNYLSEGLRCMTLQELVSSLPTDEGLETLVRLNPDILIPLTSKGHLHGIIVLGNRIEGNEFTDIEKEYLLHIAGFAAIALHNAYLFEMTTTDMMTRLKTRHYFENALNEYIEHWYSPEKKLSLILLDIDHFKRINDTYGHVYGDKVIVRIAHIIREKIRRNDIAARYGGEEFVVVLPDADLNEAYQIAERIRKNVEKSPVITEGHAASVTLSLGVTEYSPKKHKHVTVFVDKADIALYKSKENGRNRTSKAL